MSEPEFQGVRESEAGGGGRSPGVWLAGPPCVSWGVCCVGWPSVGPSVGLGSLPSVARRLLPTSQWHNVSLRLFFVSFFSFAKPL